jgi:hypothetical protein
MLRGPLRASEKKLTDRQTLRIERFGTIESTNINNQIDQSIEIGDGAAIADFGTFDSKLFSLAVDTFARGTLVIDDFIEGTSAIQHRTHDATGFDVNVFDTAFAFFELLMVAGLACLFWVQERTTVALGFISIGMLMGERGMHAQSLGTQRNTIRIAFDRRVAVLIQGNGSDATATGWTIVDVPCIISGVSRKVCGKMSKGEYGSLVQGVKIGNVIFIERQGIFCEHDIAIIERGSSGNTRAIAPKRFDFLLA